MNREDRATPTGLWRYSKEFFDAAKRVVSPPKSKIDDLRSETSIPAYYLVAHAIELVLKAFLRDTGTSVKELRGKKFGHDLEGLLSGALQKSLDKHVKLTKTDIEIICLLNQSYFRKEFEYFEIGHIRLPSYRHICSTAEKLIDGLKRRLWFDKIRTGRPIL